VLANGRSKGSAEDRCVTYRWLFKVPNPSEIDATPFWVHRSGLGEPPIIEFIASAIQGLISAVGQVHRNPFDAPRAAL